MESWGRSKHCYIQPRSGQGLCVRRRGHRRGPSCGEEGSLPVPGSRCRLVWDSRAVLGVPLSSGQLQLVVIHISVSNPF